MRIKKIRIRNFRKLQDVRIDIQHENTVFIGANNSGKTSAMTALRYFLKNNENNSFCIYDFTLSNHQRIRDIGQKLKMKQMTRRNLEIHLFGKKFRPH